MFSVKLHISTILEIQCISQITLLKTRKGKTFQIIFFKLITFQTKVKRLMCKWSTLTWYAFIFINPFIHQYQFIYVFVTLLSHCQLHRDKVHQTNWYHWSNVKGHCRLRSESAEAAQILTERVKGKTRTRFQYMSQTERSISKEELESKVWNRKMSGGISRNWGIILN